MRMRHILITGANKGIGKATVAAALSAADDTKVLLGSRNLKRGQEARAELVSSQPSWESRIQVVEIDVASDASVLAAAEQIREMTNREALYGIVNNAGIGLGSQTMAEVCEVNVKGIERVTSALAGSLCEGGRIVNVTSAAGPNFVERCNENFKKFFVSGDSSWNEIRQLVDECSQIAESEEFQRRGLGDGNAYGFSKACANALTLYQAQKYPSLRVNSCTPGFIETDLTRNYAESAGKTPSEMGMKSPEEGTRAAIHLLFGDISGSGQYFGSDAKRSPLHEYRSPGSPEYAP